MSSDTAAPAATPTAPSAAPSTSAPSTAVPSTLEAPVPPASDPGPAHTGVDGKGIRIGEAAMKQLGVLLQQQGPEAVLRVGVRSGGCSGMSYTMDFVTAADIRSDDEVYAYEPEGGPAFRVVCDPKSLLYIYGLQLDFSTALIGGGFNFTNPNATQTCGCGSSFAV